MLRCPLPVVSRPPWTVVAVPDYGGGSDVVWRNPYDRPKPLLRGWLHAVGAVAALITTVILLVETAGDWARFLSLLVFGLSMILLYVVSAIYHIGT